MATKFSGGKPEGFTLPSNGVNARIKIGNIVYSYNSYNDSSGQLTLFHAAGGRPLATTPSSN